MTNQFLTNYTETTFLEKIKDNLRRCNSFCFSVSFISSALFIKYLVRHRKSRKALVRSMQANLGLRKNKINRWMNFMLE